MTPVSPRHARSSAPVSTQGMTPTRAELDRAQTLVVLERWVGLHGRMPREGELPEVSSEQIESQFGSWKRARRHVLGARTLHHR